MLRNLDQYTNLTSVILREEMLDIMANSIIAFTDIKKTFYKNRDSQADKQDIQKLHRRHSDNEPLSLLLH